MLSLSIAPADVSGRSVPGPHAAGVVVWRHVDGELVAHGGTDEQGPWMHVAGVGTFALGPGESVVAYPEPSASQALVEDAFRRTVLPMALQVRGQEVLHASAVLSPRGVVALCAVSETGKSTTAYALSRRGYALWGDDAVAVELSTGGPISSSLEFRLSLRPKSAAFFGSTGEGSDLRAGSSTRPLAAICVLRRGADARTGIRRMSPEEAFTEVLTHAYCFDLDDPTRKRAMMETYLQLVERVPTYEVQLPDGLEHVDVALDRIEQTVIDG